MSIRLTTVQDGELRQRIELEGFETLYTDVSRALGGDDSAPDPHDYFVLSLGACKAITVQMYARRKEWSLDGISVVINCDERDEAHGVYRLDVAMTFHGALDEVQRERLRAISDKCPIHRLMTTTRVEITTRQRD